MPKEDIVLEVIKNEDYVSYNAYQVRIGKHKPTIGNIEKDMVIDNLLIDIDGTYYRVVSLSVKRHDQ